MIYTVTVFATGALRNWVSERWRLSPGCSFWCSVIGRSRSPPLCRSGRIKDNAQSICSQCEQCEGSGGAAETKGCTQDLYKLLHLHASWEIKNGKLYCHQSPGWRWKLTLSHREQAKNSEGVTQRLNKPPPTHKHHTQWHSRRSQLPTDPKTPTSTHLNSSSCTYLLFFCPVSTKGREILSAFGAITADMLFPFSYACCVWTPKGH